MGWDTEKAPIKKKRAQLTSVNGCRGKGTAMANWIKPTRVCTKVYFHTGKDTAPVSTNGRAGRSRPAHSIPTWWKAMANWCTTTARWSSRRANSSTTGPTAKASTPTCQMGRSTARWVSGLTARRKDSASSSRQTGPCRKESGPMTRRRAWASWRSKTAVSSRVCSAMTRWWGPTSRRLLQCGVGLMTLFPSMTLLISMHH